MKKKFGVFCKDVYDLNLVFGRFLRKHWIGTIIYMVLCAIVFFVSAGVDLCDVFMTIGDWFVDTFRKVKRFFKRKVHKA